MALACGCGTQRRENDYQAAVLALRNANVSQALTLTQKLERSCPPASVCLARARLLEAEILLTERRLPAADAILSESPPASMDTDALKARRSMLQGAVRVAASALDEAEGPLRAAQDLASSIGAWDVLVDAETWRGQLLFRSGHREQAEKVFRHAAAEATARHDVYREATALNGLGMMRVKENRFDEAIPGLNQIVRLVEHQGLPRALLFASTNLAICYSNLGNFEAALASLRRGLDLLGESGLASYRMSLLGEIGNTYMGQGDTAEAIASFQKALALAQTDEDKSLWSRNLASAFVEAKDWAAAEQSNQRAASLVKELGPNARVTWNSAAIAAGNGRFKEACDLYGEAIELGANNPSLLWESHAGLADTYTRLGKDAAADREFAKALAVIDRNGADIASTDNQVTFFAALNGFYRNYVAALLRRRADQRALEIADSSRARILFQRLSSSGEAAPPPSGRDYRAIARQTNSTLLFYFLAPGKSYLWVVTGERIHPPIELPAAEEIQGLVEGYRKFVEQRIGDSLATENPAGRRLYEILIAPVNRLLPRNADVILVPDGALHWLNFETLPVYSGEKGNHPHYWIEDVRLVVAPSLAALTTRKDATPHAPDSLLVIGDPVSPGPEYPQLAYAAQEIANIRRHFPAGSQDTFVGAKARPGAYEQSHPANFALLHFSAHGVANPQSPLDSAIILSKEPGLSKEGGNFKLYARNIMAVPLQADLVTISACRSAGARSYSGEGLVGFVWAFLQAGARNVIAGLWDVTDSSTPGMMDVLYAQIREGHSAADALRTAKLALIHSTGNYRKPYYWGPFQLYTR